MPGEWSPVSGRVALILALAGCFSPAGVLGQPVIGSEAAQRGYQLLLSRQDSGCVLCHRITGLPVGGDIGPSLQGLAARYSAQLVHERIANPRRFNPDSVMPAYLGINGLTNVAQAYRGKAILSEQELDDIVVYLMQAERIRP
jgi:sulfur-oxidizing protein SoxX